MKRFKYTTIETHISDISAFDTVIHDGVMKTVCENNIKRGGFMGTSLFGDCYASGHKPVLKVIFEKPPA